jgi:hypothetical protein
LKKEIAAQPDEARIGGGQGDNDQIALLPLIALYGIDHHPPPQIAGTLRDAQHLADARRLRAEGRDDPDPLRFKPAADCLADEVGGELRLLVRTHGRAFPARADKQARGGIGMQRGDLR